MNLTVGMAQILAQAEVLFGSGVALRDVGAILIALMPHILGYVLPIAFLLGAVLGVGRLAEDREIMAIAATGFSPTRLVRVRRRGCSGSSTPPSS